MNNDFVEVDTARVNAQFDALQMTQPEARKAIRGGLREAMALARSAVRSAAATVTSDREKARKGVQLTVYKNGSGAIVHIMKPFYLSEGPGHYGRRLFRLMWLEEGTRASSSGRMGIDGHRRAHGATPAHHFFATAVRGTEGQVEEILTESLIKHINKVASKRK